MRIFIAHFRLYVYNVFLNKIPFNFLRMFFVRRYMVVGKNSYVSMNVKLLNLSIRRDQVQIGNNCVINPGVLLDGREGKIIIHNNVDIARDTYIFTAQHDPHSDHHEIKFGDVIIEDHCWIASRVTILPNTHLGRGCVVACGAVVTKDVQASAVVGGIPAKVIGERRSRMMYNLNYSPSFYV